MDTLERNVKVLLVLGLGAATLNLLADIALDLSEGHAIDWATNLSLSYLTFWGNLLVWTLIHLAIAIWQWYKS